jgi:hypothetical protein
MDRGAQGKVACDAKRRRLRVAVEVSAGRSDECGRGVSGLSEPMLESDK